MHILAVNKRERELIKLVELASTRLSATQCKLLLLYQKARGPFFTASPMDFYGGSFIADHAGGMMAEMEEQAGIALATVDLDEVRRYREGWGSFRDIRPDIYA